MLRFLRRTAGASRPYWPLLLLVAVGVVAAVAFQTILPLSFRLIIDEAIVPKDARALRLVLWGLPTAAAVYIAVTLVSDRALVRLTAHVVNDLRLSVFRHLQGLSIEFFSRTRPGDISARFSSDLADVEYALVNTLTWGVASALAVLVSVIVLFGLQWQLALLGVGGLPLALLGPRLLSKRSAEAAYLNKREQGAMLDMVSENLNAQPVVKVFALERFVIRAFTLRLTTLFGYGVRAHFLEAMMERVPSLSVAAFTVAVACVGGWLAFSGALSVGSLVAFYAVFAMLSESVTNLMWALPFLVRAAAAQRRIDEILDEVPTVADPDVPVPLNSFEKAFEFNDVSFGYGHDRPVLTDISLSIPRGMSVAIVGPSGCGKSTLLTLMLRIYDATAGSVTIDGIDVRYVSQENLRHRFGVVLQDTFLFNASISDNIRTVSPDATDEQIEAAARVAEIHDAIVKLPDGYETLVGDRGTRLSPGQRQRVAIARALIRDPDILLLDEATSALDAASEAAVDKTIRRLAADRTVISITHRLSSVVHVDRVVIMDDGRIAGQGKHSELLSRNAVYRDLWEKQTRFALNNDGRIDPDALRSIRLFAGLDEDSIRAIGLLLVTEQHPAYTEVLSEGDPGDKLYLIVRGSVEVYRQSNEEDSYVLSEGDHFGEIALLEQGPRTATVRTRGPATMLTLNHTAFRSLLAASPALREAVEASARERRFS